MVNGKLSFGQKKTIKKITYFTINCFTALFSIKQSIKILFLTLTRLSLSHRLRTSKLSLPLCSSLFSSYLFSQALSLFSISLSLPLLSLKQFFFTDQYQIQQIDTRSTIGKVVWLIFNFLGQKMLQCLFLYIYF